MIHDEKTTEIEIPTKKTGNIVRVNFPAHAERREITPSTTPAVVRSLPRQNDHHWFRELDLSTPWILRLVAVIAILILSMLMV